MIEAEKAAALARHVDELRACRRCAGVQAPPVAADAVPGAEILLVGQAPGPHERDSNRLFAFTAGTRLFSWFASLGVNEEEFRGRVWMSATIRCFPGRLAAGGDRSPSPQEIAACRPFLEREIGLLQPSLVLAVGSLSIACFLGAGPLAERVGRMFTADFAGHSLEVLPLPHPSGRSTWINQPQNANLLGSALALLAESPAWRRTFARPA
jgi:uracil-DNA glycosylase